MKFGLVVFNILQSQTIIYILNMCNTRKILNILKKLSDFDKIPNTV